MYALGTARGSISYHNITYDIINWTAMILDMISYVSLSSYCLSRQPPLLLPGWNSDTGYTAANLQPCLWSWSWFCWPAYPTRSLRWRAAALQRGRGVTPPLAGREGVQEHWIRKWAQQPCHAGREHGGKEAECWFAKAVESELPQGGSGSCS